MDNPRAVPVQFTPLSERDFAAPRYDNDNRPDESAPGVLWDLAKQTFGDQNIFTTTVRFGRRLGLGLSMEGSSFSDPAVGASWLTQNENLLANSFGMTRDSLLKDTGGKTALSDIVPALERQRSNEEMAKLQSQLPEDSTLAAGTQLAASLGAGLFDPINLIPLSLPGKLKLSVNALTGGMKAAKSPAVRVVGSSLQNGYAVSLFRGGAEGAYGGLVQGGLSEAIKAGMSEDPNYDYLGNVVGATAAGGTLGATFGVLGNFARRLMTVSADLSQTVPADAERADLSTATGINMAAEATVEPAPKTPVNPKRATKKVTPPAAPAAPATPVVPVTPVDPAAPAADPAVAPAAPAPEVVAPPPPAPPTVTKVEVNRGPDKKVIVLKPFVVKVLPVDAPVVSDPAPIKADSPEWDGIVKAAIPESADAALSVAVAEKAAPPPADAPPKPALISSNKKITADEEADVLSVIRSKIDPATGQLTVSARALADGPELAAVRFKNKKAGKYHPGKDLGELVRHLRRTGEIAPVPLKVSFNDTTNLQIAKEIGTEDVSPTMELLLPGVDPTTEGFNLDAKLVATYPNADTIRKMPGDNQTKGNRLLAVAEHLRISREGLVKSHASLKGDGVTPDMIDPVLDSITEVLGDAKDFDFEPRRDLADTLTWLKQRKSEQMKALKKTDTEFATGSEGMGRAEKISSNTAEAQEDARARKAKEFRVDPKLDPEDQIRAFFAEPLEKGKPQTRFEAAQSVWSLLNKSQKEVALKAILEEIEKRGLDPDLYIKVAREQGLDLVDLDAPQFKEDLTTLTKLDEEAARTAEASADDLLKDLPKGPDRLRLRSKGPEKMASELVKKKFGEKSQTYKDIRDLLTSLRDMRKNGGFGLAAGYDRMMAELQEIGFKPDDLAEIKAEIETNYRASMSVHPEVRGQLFEDGRLDAPMDMWEHVHGDPYQATSWGNYYDSGRATPAEVAALKAVGTNEERLLLWHFLQVLNPSDRAAWANGITVKRNAILPEGVLGTFASDEMVRTREARAQATIGQILADRQAVILGGGRQILLRTSASVRTALEEILHGIVPGVLRPKEASKLVSAFWKDVLSGQERLLQAIAGQKGLKLTKAQEVFFNYYKLVIESGGSNRPMDHPRNLFDPSFWNSEGNLYLVDEWVTKNVLDRFIGGEYKTDGSSLFRKLFDYMRWILRGDPDSAMRGVSRAIESRIYGDARKASLPFREVQARRSLRESVVQYHNGLLARVERSERFLNFGQAQKERLDLATFMDNVQTKHPWLAAEMRAVTLGQEVPIDLPRLSATSKYVTDSSRTMAGLDQMDQLRFAMDPDYVPGRRAESIIASAEIINSGRVELAQEEVAARVKFGIPLAEANHVDSPVGFVNQHLSMLSRSVSSTFNLRNRAPTDVLFKLSEAIFNDGLAVATGHVKESGQVSLGTMMNMAEIAEKRVTTALQDEFLKHNPEALNPVIKAWEVAMKGRPSLKNVEDYKTWLLSLFNMKETGVIDPSVKGATEGLKLIDEWQGGFVDDLRKAGLLTPEDEARLTTSSGRSRWMHHSWNRDMIRAHYDKFIDLMTDNLIQEAKGRGNTLDPAAARRNATKIAQNMTEIHTSSAMSMDGVDSRILTLVDANAFRKAGFLYNDPQRFFRTFTREWMGQAYSNLSISQYAGQSAADFLRMGAQGRPSILRLGEEKNLRKLYVAARRIQRQIDNAEAGAVVPTLTPEQAYLLKRWDSASKSKTVAVPIRQMTKPFRNLYNEVRPLIDNEIAVASRNPKNTEKQNAMLVRSGRRWAKLLDEVHDEILGRGFNDMHPITASVINSAANTGRAAMLFKSAFSAIPDVANRTLLRLGGGHGKVSEMITRLADTVEGSVGPKTLEMMARHWDLENPAYYRGEGTDLNDFVTGSEAAIDDSTITGKLVKKAARITEDLSSGAVRLGGLHMVDRMGRKILTLQVMQDLDPLFDRFIAAYDALTPAILADEKKVVGALRKAGFPEVGDFSRLRKLGLDRESAEILRSYRTASDTGLKVIDVDRLMADYKQARLDKNDARAEQLMNAFRVYDQMVGQYVIAMTNTQQAGTRFRLTGHKGADAFLGSLRGSTAAMNNNLGRTIHQMPAGAQTRWAINHFAWSLGGLVLAYAVAGKLPELREKAQSKEGILSLMAEAAGRHNLMSNFTGDAINAAVRGRPLDATPLIFSYYGRLGASMFGTVNDAVNAFGGARFDPDLENRIKMLPILNLWQVQGGLDIIDAMKSK